MKFIKLIFSRFFIFGIALLLQIAWFIFFVIELSQFSTMINALLTILSIIAVLWLMNKQDNPAYKLAWVIPILLFPILGGLLYVLMRNKKPSRKIREKLDIVLKKSNLLLIQDNKILDELDKTDKSIANQAKYLINTATFPIYKNTTTNYFRSGEDNYLILIEELEKAKHFIFMEYFIIEEGVMWNSILDILERKVKEGVDVRVIYDDVGSLSKLPFQYYKRMEKMGIKCEAFNRYIPFFSVIMNNRDHRKITVIDGHTAFTGGINLADEYINEIQRFGYWKDSGIMIKGDAVWNFTIMFLQMWNGIRQTDNDYSLFMPHVYYNGEFESDGYVQPYGDSPLDEETVGENVYLNMIGGAKNYVYIFTPYLIIDNEIMTALCIAAKKGVDVRIVTPSIPDKKIVYLVTKSYYGQLVAAGVKIYHYLPGFIHSKCFVCDDEIAAVGSINMDFRSFYLHFECGVLIYKSKAVLQLKQDAEDIFEKSLLITKEDCNKNLLVRLLQAVLRLFAPLM